MTRLWYTGGEFSLQPLSPPGRSGIPTVYTWLALLVPSWYPDKVDDLEAS